MAYKTERIFLKSITLVILLVSIGFLVSTNLNIPLSELKKEFTNEDSQFIEIESIPVHFRIEGNGPNLLLLHGTGASLHTWDEWTKILKEHYKIIRLDLPGFGLTGPFKNKDYSIEHYTQFLYTFLKRLNIEQTSLVGNSLGGRIAWNFAADYAETADRLILICPSGFPIGRESTAFKIAKTPVLKNIVTLVTPKQLIRKSLKEVFYDDRKVSAEMIDRYWKMLRRKGNREAFVDRANTEFSDETEKLKSIDCRTQIMWGKYDDWIPVAHADLFAEKIPASEVEIFKYAGHIPMEELPEMTAYRALEFLRDKD